MAAQGQLAADERAQIAAFARRAGSRAALRAAYEASPLRGVTPQAGTAGAVLLAEVTQKP
jgi:hypothetical protein